jgi:hypothetical protein
MDTKTFNSTIDEMIQHCGETLMKKAEEYAKEDRLHNFKVSAALGGDTPAQALWGMARKHIVSISDMVREDGEVAYTQQQWDEKIGDAINYLLLLKAVVAEVDTDAAHPELELYKEDADVQ